MSNPEIRNVQNGERRRYGPGISWGNKQNAAAKIDESVKIGIWGYFCMRKKKKYGALRET